MTDTSDLEKQARIQAVELGHRVKGAVKGKPRESANAAQAMAGWTEDAARQMRSLDLMETVQEISTVASRNLLLVLSAAARLGAAAPSPQNAAH